MTEDFLQFIWRTRNFNFRHLSTTDGHLVEILDFGKWNTSVGPDFIMGRVVIDGVHWAGNIEIHVSASDWNRHGHTSDPIYETVVLHVVLVDDGPVYAGTQKIPCVELKDRIDPRLLGQYARLMSTQSWVPCAAHLGVVPSLIRTSWLERMLVERIEHRAHRIYSMLEESSGDWEDIFYRCLASAYGFKFNSAPFGRLARLVPLKCVYKHQDSPQQVEAMLFGAAGMLNLIFTEDYPLCLQREFFHLSTKYKINSMDSRAWTWGKLRPANFPTIRIAQFASIMTQFQGLFRKMLESPDIASLRSFFVSPVSVYWQTHSDFEKTTTRTVGKMGLHSVDSILINTVVPFLFCYGKRGGGDRYVELSLELIAALPKEENSITKRWSDISMLHDNAGHSQALIHLKTEYCDRRRCAVCAIGNQILTSSPQS